jgi:hypothetical protein
VFNLGDFWAHQEAQKEKMQRLEKKQYPPVEQASKPRNSDAAFSQLVGLLPSILAAIRRASG